MTDESPSFLIAHETYGEGLGHFYVGLKNVDKNITWFGKSPFGRGKERLHGYGVISITQTHYNDLKKKSMRFTMTKEIRLTKENYEKAMQYGKEAETSDDLKYTAGFNDCADFAQEMYHAAGLPAYFTTLFTREQLAQDLKTDASLKALAMYGSRDSLKMILSRMKALNKEELAKKLNISVDWIIECKDIINDEVLPVFTVDIPESSLPSLVTNKNKQLSSEQRFQFQDRKAKIVQRLAQAIQKFELQMLKKKEQLEKKAEIWSTKNEGHWERAKNLQEQADQYGIQLEAERQAETKVYFAMMTAQKEAANEGGTIDATHITRQKQSLYDAFVSRLQAQLAPEKNELDFEEKEIKELTDQLFLQENKFVESFVQDIRNCLEKLICSDKEEENAQALSKLEQDMEKIESFVNKL